MRTWAIGLSVLLAWACAATSTYGEQITVTATGAASGLGVSGMSISSNVGSTSYAGMYNWSVTSPGDVAGTTFTGLTSFNTFCIQMGQSFSGGSKFTFNVSSINNANPIGGNDSGYIDPTAAGQMQLLADQYFGLVNNGAKTVGGNSYTVAEIAAAFQLSLWEIEYDGGAGQNSTAPVIPGIPESYPRADGNYFGTGNFKASGGGTQGAAAITLANYFLGNFTVGNRGLDTNYASLALTQACKQDQFWGIPNGTIPHTEVPLPAALPAGLTVLIGLGAYRKIRAKIRG